jgi:hypothetical protein
MSKAHVINEFGSPEVMQSWPTDKAVRLPA